MLGTAEAVLGWSEKRFWHSTPFGFAAGIEMHNELNDPDSKTRKKREHDEWQRKLEAGEVKDVPDFVHGEWTTRGERVKGS